MKFESLELKQSLIDALILQNITEATEIQAKAIPALLEQKIDFVGQAQTGTGKTLAFLLPLIQNTNFNSINIQSLILAPTRELASQIAAEASKLLGNEAKKIEIVYGGQPVTSQVRNIEKNRPAIIVGTPGRVKDLCQRKLIDFSECKTCILDEADEMLDMGFLEDVRAILGFLNQERKTWMFSATMPKEIKRLVSDFFQNPFEVQIEKKTLSNEDVEQTYYLTRYVDKFDALSRLLDSLDDFFLIIFCKTKIETKELSDELNRRGFQSDALHGDMVQDQRDLTMERFKRRHIKILVCTDVAARGIDVDNITHVINFGLPQDNESYVHRIGRTGRAGRKGLAISLLDSAENSRIEEIERLTNAKIERKYLPEIEKIKSSLVKRETSQIDYNSQRAINHSLENEYDAFMRQLEGCSKEDLINSIFTSSIQDRLLRYQGAEKIDIEPYKRKPVKVGYKKYFINLGRNDGIDLGDLLKIICRNCDIPGTSIGKIFFKDSFSFFEIKVEFVDKLDSLSNLDFSGKKIVCEESKVEGSKKNYNRKKSLRI